MSESKSANEKLGTVFVVEDEEPIRILVETVLNRAGFEVITAKDGLDAERKIGEMVGEIDLLVTDLVLPGMNGDDLALSIRKLRPEMKVLFASGSFGAAPEEIARRVPGATFILKPFSAVKLVVAVRAALANLGQSVD